jgi:hypothetical protein
MRVGDGGMAVSAVSAVSAVRPVVVLGVPWPLVEGRWVVAQWF